MAVLHCAVLTLSLPVLVFLSRREPGTLMRRVFSVGLFLGLLLIVSSLANGIWGCWIYNHVYHSADYIFDFTPFWPVTMNADRPQIEGFGSTLSVNGVHGAMGGWHTV